MAVVIKFCYLKIGIIKIAPQNKYKGGTDQILLPLNYSEEWVKSITDFKTKNIYSLKEFKEKFPTQIK